MFVALSTTVCQTRHARHVSAGKQKSTTKSSTEAELMATVDYASQVLWMRNFLMVAAIKPQIQHRLEREVVDKKGSDDLNPSLTSIIIQLV